MNWASKTSTGLGRRFAVISCAWLSKIVDRSASNAWLCCNARRSASSRVTLEAGAADWDAFGGRGAEGSPGAATSCARRMVARARKLATTVRSVLIETIPRVLQMSRIQVGQEINLCRQKKH